uniref:Uncharacterized protein n=1 Tax=Physcomitrium patens TaxID=3218 RepID=A0A2K1L7A7_PHYPA|nr:hypothetical protein PHYPA_000295 [Physcomitrium patens]
MVSESEICGVLESDLRKDWKGHITQVSLLGLRRSSFVCLLICFVASSLVTVIESLSIIIDSSSLCLSLNECLVPFCHRS